MTETEKLTHTERRVIHALATEWPGGYGGGHTWPGASWIAPVVNRTSAQVLRACRSLAKKGLATYQHTVDEDDRVNGSGYFLRGDVYEAASLADSRHRLRRVCIRARRAA